MMLPLLLSLVVSVTDDPPVKVWLNHDNYFPRGDETIEVRGRGDREAFFVDDREGSGLVLAARSSTPFKFDEFVRGDHWDYRVLDARQAGDDKEAALVDMVQRMTPDGHFDYDAVTYVVASARAYYDSYYPQYAVNFGYGWGRPYGYRYAALYSTCYDPFFYDPFLCYDPIFSRPSAFTATGSTGTGIGRTTAVGTRSPTVRATCSSTAYATARACRCTSRTGSAPTPQPAGWARGSASPTALWWPGGAPTRRPCASATRCSVTAAIECRSRCETVVRCAIAVGCAMAATVQTALSPRRASPIGGARVAGAAGAAIVTPGGPLRSGAAAVVVVGAVGGVPRVRQAVVTAAAGRLPAAGEMGAGAGGAGAGTTATAAEGRAA